MHSKQTTQKLSVQGTCFVNLTFKSLGRNLDFPHSRWVPQPQRYLILQPCHLLLVSTRNSIRWLTNLFWWKFLWNWYLPAKKFQFPQTSLFRERENSKLLLTISLMGKMEPFVRLGNGQLGWHICPQTPGQAFITTKCAEKMACNTTLLCPLFVLYQKSICFTAARNISMVLWLERLYMLYSQSLHPAPVQIP